MPGRKNGDKAKPPRPPAIASIPMNTRPAPMRTMGMGLFKESRLLFGDPSIGPAGLMPAALLRYIASSLPRNCYFADGLRQATLSGINSVTNTRDLILSGQPLPTPLSLAAFVVPTAAQMVGQSPSQAQRAVRMPATAPS